MNFWQYILKRYKNFYVPHIDSEMLKAFCHSSVLKDKIFNLFKQNQAI
jgi:hypothetical protein